jgi:fatty-acid desaturase
LTTGLLIPAAMAHRDWDDLGWPLLCGICADIRIVAFNVSGQFSGSLARKSALHYQDHCRNNFIVGLLASDEGYHSFHHRFPSDYQNSERWILLDSTEVLFGYVKVLI